MATSKPTWAKVTGAILDLLQLAIALGVVVLVSSKLLRVDVKVNEALNEDEPIIRTGCVLSPPSVSVDSGDDESTTPLKLSGVEFCVYALAVGLLSMIVNTVFGCVRNVFKCVTLNACAASRVVEVVGDVALAIWWGVAFALFVRRGVAANDAGLPNRPARDGVIALAFGGMSAFAADAIIALWTMFR